MSGKQLTFGIVLILIGSFFLLQSLDLIWISFGDMIQAVFPLGLICAGGWLIMRKRQQEQATPPPEQSAGYNQSAERSDRGYDSASYTNTDTAEPGPVSSGSSGPTPPPPPNEEYQQRYDSSSSKSQTNYSSDRTKYSNFFGDLNVTCDNINMRNVEISGFLGDIEVFLRDAQLEPGLSRMVISGFIGDVRIMVPRGLAVFANGSNFIGDLDLFGRRASGFGNNIDAQTADYQEADKKLYIAINNFIGDIKVYEV